MSAVNIALWCALIQALGVILAFFRIDVRLLNGWHVKNQPTNRERVMALLSVGAIVFALVGWWTRPTPSNTEITPASASIALTREQQWAETSKQWLAYKPIVVSGQTFRNREVLLDGTYYINSEFFGVTFKFNGTAPVFMSYDRVVAPLLISSDNPVVTATAQWLYSMGYIRGDVVLLNASGKPMTLPKLTEKP
jgi:hypothetical protein